LQNDALGEYGPETLRPRELPDSREPVELSEPAIKRLWEELETAAEAGTGSWLEQVLLDPAEVSASDAVHLEAWLRRQQSRDRVRECLQTVAGDLANDVTRMPYILRPTRSELIRQSIGWPAVYHSNNTPGFWQPLGVYVDVSGSMHCRLREILAILQSLKESLPVVLRVFDTTVTALQTIDMLKGNLFCGAGTDFNCVWENAIESSMRDFIVLTDGQSSVSTRWQQRAREVDARPRGVLFGRKSSQPWWWAEFHWRDNGHVA